MAPDDRAVDHMLPVVGQAKLHKGLKQCVPYALLCPPAKTNVNGIPFAIAFVQVAPWAANAQDMQHAIQIAPIVMGRT